MAERGCYFGANCAGGGWDISKGRTGRRLSRVIVPERNSDRSIFQLEGHFDGLHRLDGLSVEQRGLIAELAGGIDSGHY